MQIMYWLRHHMLICFSPGTSFLRCWRFQTWPCNQDSSCQTWDTRTTSWWRRRPRTTSGPGDRFEPGERHWGWRAPDYGGRRHLLDSRQPRKPAKDRWRFFKLVRINTFSYYQVAKKLPRNLEIILSSTRTKAISEARQQKRNNFTDQPKSLWGSFHELMARRLLFSPSNKSMEIN